MQGGGGDGDGGGGDGDGGGGDGDGGGGGDSNGGGGKREAGQPLLPVNWWLEQQCRSVILFERVPGGCDGSRLLLPHQLGTGSNCQHLGSNGGWVHM